MQGVINKQSYCMLNSCIKVYSELIFMDCPDNVGDSLFNNSGILEKLAEHFAFSFF